jgi:hypothetical protein
LFAFVCSTAVSAESYWQHVDVAQWALDFLKRQQERAASQ